jgi:hypothetical protein
MLNLDLMAIDELEEFIVKAEQDSVALAKEIFPTENSKRVRAINLLVKYAQERKEMLRQTSKGRFKEADKHKEKAFSIYRAFPDFSKWDN